MNKIGVPISNSKIGLHKGHIRLIEWAKQYGDVSIILAEDLEGRYLYLRDGISKGKYKVDVKPIEKFCDELNVGLEISPYIEIDDEWRRETFVKIEQLKNILYSLPLFPTHILNACSLINSVRVRRLGSKYDRIVMGAEATNYFLKILLEMMDGIPVLISDFIVKDKNNLKISSTLLDSYINPSDLAPAIALFRSKFKIGSNPDIVKEINELYPISLGWKVRDIFVYDNELVGGRMEYVVFSILTPYGWRLYEDVTVKNIVYEDEIGGSN